MKHRRAWIWLVSLLALVVRLCVVIVQHELSIFDISFEGGDGPLYVSIAKHLLDGTGFAGPDGVPTAFVTPGYPIFLAGLFLVSDSILFVGICQSIVGTLGVALLALATDRLAGRAAAVATGIAAALYPHSLLWTTQVMTETLYVSLIAVAVYLLTRLVYEQGNGGWVAIACGAAAAAAALVRPPILGFAVLLVVAGAIRGQWRRRALLGLLGLVIVYSPWVIRNVVQMDALVVTSTESGYVLWQGNSPGATGGTRGYVDLADFHPIEFPESTNEVARDRIYLRRSLEWIAENPGRVIALFPEKLANMWRPSWEGASNLNLAATLLTYPLLLTSGIAGLILLRTNTLVQILIAWLLYQLLLHALVTGMIRFRLPLEMVLMIPAGAGLARLVSLLDKRRSPLGTSS